MKKKILKIGLGIIGGIGIIICFGKVYYDNYLDPYREVVEQPVYSESLGYILTKKEAKKDLKYVYKQLKTYHPAYLDGSDSLVDAVEKQYQLELEQLEEEMTTTSLWQATARIMSKLEDGHSLVRPNYSQMKYIDHFSMYKESKLIKIDNVDITDLYQKFLEQFSYELEAYAKYQFEKVVTREDYLKFLGLDTEDGVDFTFDTSNGEETYHYEFVTSDKVINKPIDEQNENFVYYNLDEENKIGILTINQCNYDDYYKKVVGEFFDWVHSKGLTQIVVDLRENGGGNSMVVNEFLSHINVNEYKISGGGNVRFGSWLYKSRNTKQTNNMDDVVFDGDIYVLTSTNTFSSAMLFTMAIADNKLGTIVGEIPGNMPTSYGDILSFQMPESKLMIQISYKKFYRVDRSKDAEPIIPDYEVSEEFALDKVYELIKSK